MTILEPHAAALPAMAADQLKAQLWADSREQVFAVLMGQRIPELPSRLAQADIVDHDCLLPGALEPAVKRLAPYLVHLKRDSGFTDWLLFEASKGLGDWGLVVCSTAKRLTLRNHLRALQQARTPDGQRMTLDWMDPPVAQILLRHFDPAALKAFLGPVSTVVIPAAEHWFSASLNLGQISLRSVPVKKAA